MVNLQLFEASLEFNPKMTRESHVPFKKAFPKTNSVIIFER